ncbi:MAG TPA: ribose-phosphate pyrophosphokinase [candidate division WOR-3 bacterium]|uniref:Ribose-phosphate pyrophosphokinase n=1 Tax=candidate division WOR-3 bacterium TaxID=2052148 RepID=A0A7V0T5L4_UNCW3|nr:ribose-phosphate pyrophosphokinase [candidate division WOR-3 bacterium]
MESKLKVFSGRANEPLARAICDRLEIEPGRCTIRNFADGEIRVKIDENVRAHDVFVVQPTLPPADNLLELLLMIDALKRASAERITAVIPYYGYARQDRKDEPRVPLSSKLVANLIERAGANRVLTMELHAEQIQGFFDIPVDHLYSTPVFIEHFPAEPTRNLVVVAPDTGRAHRARGFASRLGGAVPIAVIDKRRPEPNRTQVVSVIGKVKGLDALIYDDMIDTGGTLVSAARALMDMGALSVRALATHAVLSDPACTRLAESPLSEVIVTDTLNLPESKRIDKIRTLTISPLLAETISRIHCGQSVSSLFL